MLAVQYFFKIIQKLKILKYFSDQNKFFEIKISGIIFGV